MSKNKNFRTNANETHKVPNPQVRGWLNEVKRGSKNVVDDEFNFLKRMLQRNVITAVFGLIFVSFMNLSATGTSFYWATLFVTSTLVDMFAHTMKNGGSK